MKRLIALLCLVMLAVFVGEAGAINFQGVQGRTLRWADYANHVATAYRDTAVFSNADTPDTTEYVETSSFLFPVGAGSAVAPWAAVRLMFTSGIAGVGSQDSIIIAVDGAYSPAGPWVSGADIGYTANEAGHVYTAQILLDRESASGILTSDIIHGFPYVRFRVRNDATHGSMTAVRCYMFTLDKPDIQPAWKWKQIKWMNLSGIGAATASNAGQYVSTTLVDTTSLVSDGSADTTVAATIAAQWDTSQSIDLTDIQYHGLDQIGSGGILPLTIAIKGATLGAQSDSIFYYLDTAPTSIGPWKESTSPAAIVRATTDGAHWYNVVGSISTASGVDNNTQVLFAPFCRIRAKMTSKIAAGKCGLTGAAIYIKYLEKQR